MALDCNHGIVKLGLGILSQVGELPILSAEGSSKRVILIDCISIKLEEHFKGQMKKFFSRPLRLVYEYKY